MPRKGRINISGGIYHVIQRGIERHNIFHNNFDKEDFLRRLGKGLKETGHKCYGWVLMPNHFHLLIRTGVKPLSDLMRKLLTGYAMYFNKKYKRSGYLYQNRYKSILCQENEYLLELIRYIHLNPIRANIVKDIDQLRKYKWSGHSVILGENNIEWQSTGEILEYFGNRKIDAIIKYEKFVSEGKFIDKKNELTVGRLKRVASTWSESLALRNVNKQHLSDERVLGDENFVNSVLKTANENINKNERLIKEGWNLIKLTDKICDIFKIKNEEIIRRGKLNVISNARKVFMYIGNKELGISGQEIGKYLRITEAAVSKGVKEGEILVRENNLKLIS